MNESLSHIATYCKLNTLTVAHTLVRPRFSSKGLHHEFECYFPMFVQTYLVQEAFHRHLF